METSITHKVNVPGIQAGLSRHDLSSYRTAGKQSHSSTMSASPSNLAQRFGARKTKRLWVMAQRC